MLLDLTVAELKHVQELQDKHFGVAGRLMRDVDPDSQAVRTATQLAQLPQWQWLSESEQVRARKISRRVNRLWKLYQGADNERDKERCKASIARDLRRCREMLDAASRRMRWRVHSAKPGGNGEREVDPHQPEPPNPETRQGQAPADG